MLLLFVLRLSSMLYCLLLVVVLWLIFRCLLLRKSVLVWVLLRMLCVLMGVRWVFRGMVIMLSWVRVNCVLMKVIELLF